MVAFEISRTSPLPLHTQLLDDLRHKIITGVLAPHDVLPGEWELAKELDISRTTVQKAWQGAEEEKLLYRVPGKGTFVADLQPPTLTTSVRIAVGLIMPDFRSAFAGQLVHAVERVLGQKGMRLQVASSNYNLQDENRALQQMQQDNIGGYIVWAVAAEATTDRVLSRLSESVPTVLLDRSIAELRLPCVSSNNYAGARLAMAHLIALGHRRIAFLARPHLHLPPVAERYRAYCDSLREIGEAPALPLLIGSDQELSCYDAYLTNDDSTLTPLIERLRQPDRPTAIFAVNDWMAIRTLRAAGIAGLTVPDDLSLVGFDNLEVTQSLVPPLTTIAQDAELLGAEAAHRLSTHIGGEPLREVLTLLPTQLIVRGSTAPC